MTAGRARFLALPVFTVLIVAVAFGAAARAGAAGSSNLDRQAEIVATSVIVTLLGLCVLTFGILVLRHLLTGDRRLSPGKPPTLEFPLWEQMALGALALGALALMGFLFVHSLHPKHGGGLAGVSANTPRPLPRTSALPYSLAAGMWTAAGFALVVGAIVLYWRIRRLLRRRQQRPFHDLLGLSEPELDPTATTLREPLAAVVVADPGTEPDPRRAVIAAWMAMTDVIARLWRPRQESEAPQEYLQEALLEAGVGNDPATRLTNLFEFARWGGRQVGEEMRAEAIAALDAVRTELRDVS